MKSSINQNVQIRLTLSGEKKRKEKRKKGFQVLGLHMVPNADKNFHQFQALSL